jgi:hypothetical protein
VAVALILAGAPTRAAAQVAFSISIVSGNNQVGTINSPLPAPLVVRVTTIPSTVPLPAANVTVTWTVTSGSGVLATSTSVTNANGEASNTLTPTGPTTGVRASVPGSSVTFNETATPALDYALTNSGGVIVTAGASGATILTAMLLAGSTQPVSFTASGLPSGATAAFTPTACSPHLLDHADHHHLGCDARRDLPHHRDR